MMMGAGGYTPAEFYAMTLPEARSLLDYWLDVPPVAALLAGLVGYKSPPPPDEAMGPEEFFAHAAAIGRATREPPTDGR